MAGKTKIGKIEESGSRERERETVTFFYGILEKVD